MSPSADPCEGLAVDLTLLATLKDKLVNATDFSEVFHYFLDHFGCDPDFIALGERTESPRLVTIIAQAAGQMFGKPVTPTDVLFARLPEQGFLHGRCVVVDKVANVIYFEDIHTGLLAVIWSFAPAETKLARFRCQPLSRNLNPSAN
jgi:hypothetical protein